MFTRRIQVATARRVTAAAISKGREMESAWVLIPSWVVERVRAPDAAEVLETVMGAG
jgi:hypothetical protein